MEILKKLNKLKLDNKPILFTDKNNIKFLVDIDSSNILLLIAKGKAYIFTDERYYDSIKENNFTKKLFNKETWSFILDLVKNDKKIYVESNISLSLFNVLKQKLKIELEIFDFEKLRELKTQEEINNIKKASEIVDLVFNKLLKVDFVNKTELQIKNTLKKIALDYEIDGFSFEPIVAYGKNSAIPHWSSNNTVIKKGNPLLIDFGVIYKGYCSDMTRTIFIGKANNEFKNRYNTLLKIQEETIKLMKPNFEISKLDKYVKEKLSKENLDSFFTHSLGHGVGLEIHESPKIHLSNLDKLKPGMVITIEPGIYFKNNYGIRIEDLIVITTKGYIILNKASKKLIEC